MKTLMSFGVIGIIIILVAFVLGVIGWVKDIVKLTRTDFEAPYKAEVFYGIGAVTGAGAIIGWLDIKDQSMLTPTKQSSVFGNLDVAQNLITDAQTALASLYSDPTVRLRKGDIERAKRYIKNIRATCRSVEPILKEFNEVAK